MERKTILILGGGIGGQAAANALAAGLKGRHRVVLVDRRNDFAFSPSFLWMIVGRRAPGDIQRPLKTLLRPGVERVQADILRIDPGKKEVETSAGAMRFDYLIISLGADLAPERTPGFEEAALNLYTLEGSSRIWESLEAFSGGRIAVLIVSSPFKCPAAPYEAAFLVQDFLKRRGKSAELSVFTPEPFPMPGAGQKVGEALKSMLESKGIRFHPNSKVARIEPEGRKMIFDGGASAACDLLIGVPAHQGPKAARDSGLADEAGWIAVDRGTLATKHAGIYAIGDATAIPLAGGKALPKAGIFAEIQAQVAAADILARLGGGAPGAKFDGRGWCAIEMGSGIAGFGHGDFYAPGGPAVELRAPSRAWHWGKVLLEEWWLAPFGARRSALRSALRAGGWLKGVSARL